jgi:lipid II:glycine glycyltransferase (peptidoglycan interpeptide bridge formation enzyme)
MLLQVCREAGAVVLRLEPDWKDDLRTAAWLATHGLRPARTVQPRSTIVVSLSGSEDELLARMKPKWRYNIRLAERKGIEISTGDGNCLPAFTQLLRETSARDRFAVHQAEYYADAWHAFAPDHVCLLMAWLGDQPLAGLMVFAFGRRATYLYGASSGTERQRMPNHLLQWRAMHWARKQGCLEYDLWGIPDEVGVGLTPDDSPPAAASDRSFGGRSAGLWGVFRFKSGFGGHVERTIGAWDFVCRPAWYRLGKTMGRL